MNNLTIVGNVGNEPDMRYTPSGTAVVTLSIADNQFAGGEKVTIWWRVALWGKTAESASTHVKKGDSVAIVGEINREARIWQDKAGENRVSMEVNGRSWSFAGGSRSDNAQGTAQPAAAESAGDIPW